MIMHFLLKINALLFPLAFAKTIKTEISQNIILVRMATDVFPEPPENFVDKRRMTGNWPIQPTDTIRIRADEQYAKRIPGPEANGEDYLEYRVEDVSWIPYINNDLNHQNMVISDRRLFNNGLTVVLNLGEDPMAVWRIRAVLLHFVPDNHKRSVNNGLEISREDNFRKWLSENSDLSNRNLANSYFRIIKILFRNDMKNPRADAVLFGCYFRFMWEMSMADGNINMKAFGNAWANFVRYSEENELFEHFGGKPSINEQIAGPGDNDEGTVLFGRIDTKGGPNQTQKYGLKMSFSHNQEKLIFQYDLIKDRNFSADYYNILFLVAEALNTNDIYNMKQQRLDFKIDPSGSYLITTRHDEASHTLADSKFRNKN
ncbi:hypothetical protein ENBRE01_1809 [Enteropsectra breve]|nr:hypothetical protein ENBRE01_1809 [Enteropsectra breve]